MRSSIAITAAIATFATSALAATDCNPSYNVPGSTACYTACNVKAGAKYVSGWTMDSKSELFIESLTVMCDKTSSIYGSFMTTAGMCMAGCAGDDPELFNAEFAGACAWWNTHKNDKCTAATTTKATTTTTTTKAATTTTTKAATTTTTKDVTTTAAVTTTKATTSAAATTSATTSATATATTTTTVTATATATATVTGTTTVTVTATNCAAPTNAVCANYNTIFGKKNGDGVLGECCDTQADCTGSCVKGACDSEHNPSKDCVVKKYFGKKNGKGPAGACCRTQKDCVNDCRSGECTKY